jgi:hypothetical protein
MPPRKIRTGCEATPLRGDDLVASASVPEGRSRKPARDPAHLMAMPAEVETGAEKAVAAVRRAPSDGDLMRRRWRSLFGRHPPRSLPPALTDRILAWREQVAEAGDINPRSRAILAAALAGKAAETAREGSARQGRGEGDHDSCRPRPHAAMRVGTVLFREHAGVLHRVIVAAEGFEWEGRIYASLSAIARAITGVRWNGHRFFALGGGVALAARTRTGGRAAVRKADRASCAGDSP